MMLKKSLIILGLLLTAIVSHAQVDQFTGTWMIKGQPDANNQTFIAELQIGAAEEKTIYPAQLKIQYESFSATYHLLLIKKSAGILAISRTKYAINETPFSMGAWTILLNGTFNIETNANGNTLLSLNRIPSKKYGIPFPAISSYADSNKTTVIRISDYFRRAPVQLQKINSNAWVSADARKMLNSYDAPAYFGLIDTLFTKSANGQLFFAETHKVDNDTVSITLNGKWLFDKKEMNKSAESFAIKLDTGLNILCFFADNYGKVPPNTAKLNIELGDKRYILDFTKPENLSATFIVAKIYYYPDGKNLMLQERNARRNIVDRINQRQTKLIDSIKAESGQIMLAIWDDALEDGDSISLQINNEIFMPGIAVKKKPLFIPVSLYPGENNIIFIADNLGSIPPNTAILEIIDGKRRKSYMINTNLGQNNAIKINYDYKPVN